MATTYPRKVLFITSTYLGDAIISTSALEWLREQYPDAQITIACGEIAAPIFAAVPHLKRLYIIRKQKWGLHTLKLALAVCRQRWDFVLDIRGTGISYFLWTQKHKVWKSTHNLTQPRVQQIATLLGLTQAKTCKIHLNKKHREIAKALLPKDRPILLLSPLASWDKKCWPPENFLALAQKLTASDGLLPQATIAFLGDTKQRTSLLTLADNFPQEQRVDISGNIGLLELAACMERADLFVGNDSGLMHLAAAMGTPTLGLFGPSRPELYAPFGPKADFIRAPLDYENMMRRAQQGENLMHLISVTDTLQACEKLLNNQVQNA